MRTEELPLARSPTFQCAGPAHVFNKLVLKYEYSEGSVESTDINEPIALLCLNKNIYGRTIISW